MKGRRWHNNMIRRFLEREPSRSGETVLLQLKFTLFLCERTRTTTQDGRTVTTASATNVITLANVGATAHLGRLVRRSTRNLSLSQTERTCSTQHRLGKGRDTQQ
jgi:hypothetical protein